jgi:diguanylate cyclase (GGDEF)-like protein
MLVANRAGSTVGFKSEDLRLLETFAGQASVALEKGQLSKQLVHQAFHDALTGLANRALLVDRVDHALKRRGAGLLALLFIDLDDFKTINDSLGHEAGDQLLIAVGERLTSCLRPADTAARLGGDEFAILLEDLDAPGAQLVTQRIEEAMERPLRVGADEISASASIGLAIWDGQPTTADELLSQADLAMYRAKRAGATDHVVFEASMKLEVVERLALKADIERAVERAEFTLHYQPIVDLASGRLTSLEALVRWPHAKRGMVGPDLFIPLAEETGLIIPLGTFVLREACRRLREWHLSHPRLRKVAVNVNVSMRQLADPTFVDDVLEILTSTEVDPHCVILEITERLILETTPEILEGLERLRAVGVRLAIDDFGTGYSSLSSLRGFPVDVVKLAKDFIDTIENDASSRAYAAAIIKLGQVLGLQTLAEGIETPAQAEVLRKQGCELGQGWHFGRPAPMESIETLLASQEATLLPA